MTEREASDGISFIVFHCTLRSASPFLWECSWQGQLHTYRHTSHHHPTGCSVSDAQHMWASTSVPSYNLSVHWLLHLSCKVHHLIIKFWGPLLIIYTYPGEVIHLPGSTLPFAWWWIQVYVQFKYLFCGWDWYIQCLLELSVWIAPSKLMLNLFKINLTITHYLNLQQFLCIHLRQWDHYLPGCMIHWISNFHPWPFPHILYQEVFRVAGRGIQHWLI